MSVLNILRSLLPFHIVRKTESTLAEDGLVARNGTYFTRDEGFQRAYGAGKATGSWGESEIRWRAHVAVWAAQHAAKLDGDFVECGVNRGGLSRSILDAVDWEPLNKRFYLLDTFGGFDPRFPPEDTQHWAYGDTYEDVKRTFQSFSRVNVVRGPVPDTLSEVQTDKVAYMYIDMNTAVPELEAMRYFWPKVVPGGIVLLDDYGFVGHEQQREAHDRFAMENGFRILSLPTGQGMALK